MANEKQTGSERGGSGNFANDPQRASESGKKGGEHSHSGSQHSGSHQSGQQQGGEQHGESKVGSRRGQGTFANDHEKASEAGKKGGEHSHGGR
jgi:general stress protein YciG